MDKARNPRFKLDKSSFQDFSKLEILIVSLRFLFVIFKVHNPFEIVAIDLSGIMV